MLFLILLPASSGAQKSVLRFEHITTANGLSENAVPKVIQDRRGFMWFGTQEGLDRYDGHVMREFRHDPSDSSSLADSYVSALAEDASGYIWIGTNGGSLDRFDPRSETFVHFAPALLHGETGERRPLSAITEDSARHIWFGRVGKGLSCFDPAKGTLRTYTNSPSDPRSLSDNNVWAVYVDRAGALWAGTYDGMNRYDPARDDFERYGCSDEGTHGRGNTFTAVFETSGGTLLCAQWGAGLLAFDRTLRRLVPWSLPGTSDSAVGPLSVWCIGEDPSHVLWIGTSGTGLLRNDGRTTRQSLNEPDDPNSLSQDIVLSLCIDRGGTVWLGTTGGGVNRYSSGYRGFAHYRHSASNAQTIGDNDVWTFYEDRSGNIWVGTSGGGLDRIEKRGGFVRHYRAGDGGGLPSDNIGSICEDPDGTLWLGTKDAGVVNFDWRRNRSTAYRSIRFDSSTIGSNAVNSVHVDASGTFWAGTYYGGLSRFDRGTRKFRRFLNDPSDPGSIGDNTVFPLLDSRRGGMWVGLMGGGLDRMRDGAFTHFRHDPGNPRSLSDDRVLCLYEDRTGTLWVGTMGGGLNRFDDASGTFTRFSEQEGLPNSTVYGILEDDRGRLWLSTNRGVARFTIATGEVRSFTESDGLQSNEFNAGAYLRLRDGEFLFGGINGFNRFFPDSVRDNDAIPRVALTSFTVLGSPARFRGEIAALPEIRLTHAQNFFSIEFAALDYANPRGNSYAYMIEGFDRTWIPCGNEHVATYTNVDPGEYTFRVAAANNDGVWNREGAALRIVIVPPFWQTWWADALYVIALAGGVFGFVRFRTVKHTRALREKEARLLAQEEHEKTITSSLREKEVLLKEVHHRVKNNLQVISSLLNIQAYQTGDQSVRRLFRETQDRVRSMALVHEKLYRSADMANIDFGEYLTTVTSELMRSAYRAGITCTVHAESMFLGVDIAIPCGLIVNELVSNALKHAFRDRDRGEVIVTLRRADRETLEMTVADDGVGFPPGVDIQALTSMGMNLVVTLTGQIAGRVALDRSHGTKIVVAFPG